MPSASSRLFASVDIHQHEDPPGLASDPPAVSPGGEDVAGESCRAGRLWRENGRVMYRGEGMEGPEPARVLWARPLSGRGGPVSIMLAGKKRELAYVADPSTLDDESRKVALEELGEGLVLPVIIAVHGVRPRFGNYYWDVDTNLGRRRFLLSSPENNTFRPRPDVIVIKDVSGNCYEIASVSGLSAASKREMERVL